MDLVAYLLFYCVEIKDKPREQMCFPFISHIECLSQSSMESVVLSLTLFKPYPQNLLSV